MAGAGYLLFTAGQVLTAAQVNTYLMQQTVPQFATSAARDSALSAVLDEMLLSSQADSNCLSIYSGSAWSTIGPLHGAFLGFSPTITQLGAVAKTITHCTYQRIGRKISGSALFAITGSGTGANAIQITGFPDAASGVEVIGSGYIHDVSTAHWPVRPYFASTTIIQFHSTLFSAAALSTMIMGVGSNAMTAALASGDTISFNFEYESGSDA